MKPIKEWTRQEFESLPLLEYENYINKFDAIIILPMVELHDSGYACMSFIPVCNPTPLGRIAAGSDSICIDGICGSDYKDGVETTFKDVLFKGWTIDCLPQSGLMRIFSRHGFKLKIGCLTSCFEIFAI